MEVLQWRIKEKSVHILVAIVRFKMEILFAVISVVTNLKVLVKLVNAAIRVVAIIKIRNVVVTERSSAI